MTDLNITWTRFWKTPNQCIDFDTSLMKRWQQIGISITHYPFTGDSQNDPRRLSVIHIPDEHDDKKDKILMGIMQWEPTQITPEKVLDLCHKWYPDDIEYITLKDGILQDNRPVEDLV